MIRIETLDVRLQVEGEGDEAAFARLFDKYIRLWAAQQQRLGQRDRELQADRSLGDRDAGGTT